MLCDFSLITPEELAHMGQETEQSAAQTPQIQKSATDVSQRLSCAIRVQIQDRAPNVGFPLF